jgi:hypothetical protein
VFRVRRYRLSVESQGLRVKGEEFWIEGLWYRIWVHRFKDCGIGSRFKVQGSRFKVQGSRFKVQGSRFKVQSSRFKVQGSRFKVQGSRLKVQG